MPTIALEAQAIRKSRNGLIPVTLRKTMTHDQIYDEATKVTAKDGEVILDGPDGVDVRVTPEAAEQTADNLIDGAVEARGQRRMKLMIHKPK